MSFVGKETYATFETGRNNSVISKNFAYHIAFPERSGIQPNPGDCWKVKVVGKHPSKNILFLQLISLYSTEQERDARAAKKAAQDELAQMEYDKRRERDTELRYQKLVDFCERAPGQIITILSTGHDIYGYQNETQIDVFVKSKRQAVVSGVTIKNGIIKLYLENEAEPFEVRVSDMLDLQRLSVFRRDTEEINAPDFHFVSYPYYAV